MGRGAPSRVHRAPHPSLHYRYAQTCPSVCARRRLCERGHQLSDLVGDPLLCALNGRARTPPRSWRLELRQEYRRQSTFARSTAPKDLLGDRAAGVGCLHRGSGRCLRGIRSMTIHLDARIPSGPLGQKWDKHRFEMKLVNPANKRRNTIIVVGSGLAGGAAAATLGEQGYNVKCFCFQDSPRRAHSIAAQGGINAAKNYKNDGESVYRLFYETVKGGDFRAREGNCHRLAELSVNISDQCVAQGVPFAREYGGLLANRSFGGAQVSRTFYSRGQTGQQLLLGAYQALERQIGSGSVKMHPRTEMLDLVVIEGKARGIVSRNLATGAVETDACD